MEKNNLTRKHAVIGAILLTVILLLLGADTLFARANLSYCHGDRAVFVKTGLGHPLGRPIQLRVGRDHIRPSINQLIFNIGVRVIGVPLICFL